MSETPFDRAVTALTRDGPPRVWSLIVTLFGDLAQDEGATLSGTTLRRLAARVDIRPEAIRVALHRLKRDGWIGSRRSGREGLYFLTGYGRAQSRAASPRIYGNPAPTAGAWHVLVAGPGDNQGQDALEAALMDGDYVPVGAQAALGPGPVPGDLPDLVVLPVGDAALPGWIGALALPADLVAAADRISAAMNEVLGELPDPHGLGPLEAAALRVLAVHGWRRIALRIPDIPPSAFPRNWNGDLARYRVHGLLQRVARPRLGAIEAAARAG